MNKYFKWIFLLAIIHSILFYNKELGLSVILFTIPLLIFFIFILKTNNLIKNKYGLLLTIPIILLSLTYFIYHNSFFSLLNVLVTPILLVIMFIMTINHSSSLTKFLEDILEIIFGPFKFLGDFISQIEDYIFSKIKISNQTKIILKSLIIVLPISFIILYLLSSADMIWVVAETGSLLALPSIGSLFRL